MSDGSQVELTRPSTRGHIVEFREAPLAARTARTAATSYQDTFQRWSEGKTRGEGIVVAVIDTGIDANHPASLPTKSQPPITLPASDRGRPR